MCTAMKTAKPMATGATLNISDFLLTATSKTTNSSRKVIIASFTNALPALYL